MNLIFLFLMATQVFALKSARQGNDIYLLDVPCNKSKQIFNSLVKFSESAEESTECAYTAIEQPSNNQLCTLNVTSCVPSHVRKYQSVAPEALGPNCWNLALVMKGILPALRFADDREMSFYMRPPLCTALKSNEKPKPGDIGAMRIAGPKKEEVHGFIYISEDLVYSKNGLKDSAYSLQSLENMTFQYKKLKKEAKYRPNDPITTEYFRCQSMNQYLSTTKDIDAGILKAMDGISKVERCMETEILSNSPISPATAKSLKDIAQVLVMTANDYKSREASLNGKHKYMLASLYLRLKSITAFLYMNQVPEAPDVNTLQTAFEKSLSELMLRR